MRRFTDHDTPRHRVTETRVVSFLGASVPRCVVIMAMLIGTSDPAVAQIRGFADVGSRTFTARESFETILGSASGVVFGAYAPGAWQSDNLTAELRAKGLGAANNINNTGFPEPPPYAGRPFSERRRESSHP